MEEEGEVKDIGAAEKKEKLRKSEDKSADAGEQGLSGQSRADGKSGVAREVVESSEQTWWKTFGAGGGRGDTGEINESIDEMQATMLI